MKTRWLIVLAFGLLLFLVGCGGGTPQTYCDPALLTTVNLVDPLDGGLFVLGESHLQWAYASSTCEPEGYRAEISTDSTFATGVIGATTTLPNSSGWPIPLTAGTTYYWRVRATVGSTEGPWSQVRSFHVVLPCDVSALVAPDPLFPEEGHEFWYDAPTYQWLYPDPTCSPEGYHLQVSSDPAFSTLDIDLADDDPSTLRVPTANLTNCTVYYWRVAGRVGGVDGPFSTPLSFYINVAGGCPTVPCPMTGLLAPDPVDPGHYEVVTSLTPTLAWDYPGFCEPEGYALRLGTSHDLAGLPLQGGTGIGESWTTGALQPGTQYWWDVAAIVPPALGPFSSARTFLTGPECASSSALGVPEILSPINGEQVLSLYAWLHYQATPFGCIPDGWALDLQTDPNFAGTNLLTTYNFPGTTVITDELVNCTTYFWRVAAVQDGVQGAWSNTGSFFTNDGGNCMVSFIPEFPMAVPLVDIPCYAGPDIQFDIQGYFLMGETAPVFAQSLDGDWLVIENQDSIGTNCWVLLENVQAEGDIAALPRWEGADLQTCTRGLAEELCEELGGIYHPPGRVTTYTPSWCECP